MVWLPDGEKKLGRFTPFDRIHERRRHFMRCTADEQASKHIYLSNMTGYQKSHWLNNAGSP